MQPSICYTYYIYDFCAKYFGKRKSNYPYVLQTMGTCCKLGHWRGSLILGEFLSALGCGRTLEMERSRQTVMGTSWVHVNVCIEKAVFK